MAWADMASRMLGVTIRAFNENRGGALVVEFLRPNETPWTVDAVFDDAHREIDPNTGAIVSSTDPIIGLRIADLPEMPTNNHQFRVRGVLYRVIDVQPDGVAGLTAQLQRVKV